ncbi:hypothetical protein O3G_MSEX004306 [Manduca sexta]|uniref:Uncharacterized protein n=1 Tax=Manduca sexta TaxID=7130 RepID=A0A922CHB2_MANSE|nr:hypothetical protein O3G_MSEX004306 [Manduca sexta]
MSWLHAVVALALAASAAPATTSCKNCIALGKEEKAMFRAHSDACLPQSGVEPKVVESMLNGQLVESAALRRHVYCVLMKCKLVSKEGKLMKNAMLGKMAMRSDGKNATKVGQFYRCREVTTNKEIVYFALPIFNVNRYWDGQRDFITLQ